MREERGGVREERGGEREGRGEDSGRSQFMEDREEG